MGAGSLPDYDFNVFRRVDIGGTDGLEFAGALTVRDDNGFRDDILDDIEQAPSRETNGDQEIVSSTVTELASGETIRSRGLYRFTNNETGETYEVTEVFSQSSSNPTEQMFVFTSTAPDWLYDDTSRSFALVNSDGTLPYSSIVCFGRGTLITLWDETTVPVEALKAGDRVLTKDGSVHAVRWIGSQKVTSFGMMAAPKLRPVRIQAGALGDGLPRQDLLVSAQHRVLVKSSIAGRIFGTDEVLVPAIKLVGLDGIEVAQDVPEIEYFHILFDQHRIIYSNGALTESLFTGPEALRAISPEARTEIVALFPEIIQPDFKPVAAGLIPKRPQAFKHLVERHGRHKKPLLELS